MTTAKFEVEKLDGQNSFSLWHINMQSMTNKFGGRGAINIIQGGIAELKEKAQTTILLSLSDEALREVVIEETAHE
jgi:hypothetical protein